MKDHLKFSLPSWLFKPSKSIDSASSTVAAFSPEQAITSEKGFQGKMLPGPEGNLQEKMTVLINDTTLRYENAEGAVKTAHVIHRLIQQGFHIYIIRDSKPQLLLSTGDLSEGDPLNSEKAAEILVKNENIPRDDIVVCNFEKIEDLRSRLYEYDQYHRRLYVRDLILAQWDATHTLPVGQKFPPIIIMDHEIDERGKEFEEALDQSDFTYSAYDCYEDTTKRIKLNRRKIQEMQLIPNWSRMKEGNPSFSISKDISQFSSVKSLIFTDCSFHKDVPLIPKENQIENLILAGCARPLKFLNANIENLNQVTTLEIDVNAEIFRENYNPNFKLPESLEYLSLKNIMAAELDILLPHASRVKSLDITNRNLLYIDMGLKNAANPRLKQLSITSFRSSPGLLIKLLDSHSNLEILELYSFVIVNGTFLENSQNCNKIKKLVLKDFGFESNTCYKTISLLIENMHELEELDITRSTSDFKNYLPLYNKTNRFKSLRYLNLHNTALDIHSIQYIIENAGSLKSINLSTTSTSMITRISIRAALINAVLTKIGRSERFDYMEELDISGLHISADDLLMIIGMMPKLRILKIDNITIDGETKKYLNPNPIIDFSMKSATMEISTVKALIKNSQPISLSFMGKILDRMVGYARPLFYLKNSKSNSHELIQLDVSGGQQEARSRYIYLHPNLRSLNLANTECGDLIWSYAPSNPYLTELDLRGLSVSYHAFSQISTYEVNIETLLIDDSTIDNDKLELIKKSNMRHKNKLYSTLRNQYIKHLNAQTDRQNPSEAIEINNILSQLRAEENLTQDLISGNKIPGVVYDGLADFSEKTDPLNPPSSKPSYALSPIFKLKSGPDLGFENVRLYAYIPDFHSNPNAVVHKPIPCNLMRYNIVPCQYENPSIYEQPAYDTVFNDPRPDLNLHRPWIRFRGLTLNDQLLSLNTSISSSTFDLFFSDSDDFYYLVLKPGEQRASNITLSYDIAPFERSCHDLPDSIKNSRRPFFKHFSSPPDNGFSQKPLKEKLQDIIAHPENHACGVRADAFLSSIENNQEIQSCRGSGSQLHGWAEIKYKNRKYKIELGGAPADMEYLPMPAPVANQLLEPDPTVNPNVLSINTEKPIIAHKENPRKALERQLERQSENCNILVICRKDLYHTHLQSVRRYLRSLTPDSTLVIDKYEDALSSIPYIHLEDNHEHWEPIDPVGAEGWLKNHLHTNDRLIINWSSISDNQSTKMNSAIDLSNRHIDGVAIDKKTQIIGLICEDDHRLNDSSFLSRHSGKIFDFTSSYFQDRPHIDTDKDLRVEFYDSPLWKNFLLGVLGFDESGKPIHTSRDLLESNSSQHLIINNPPEHCEEFSRLIQDLEQGRAFKYLDKNIKVPRMKVTLTRGYDFTKLSTAVKSLTTQVKAADVQDIAIDHVITPSTFERCLGTRSIEDGKIIPGPGWLEHATTEKPLSLYITKTLSKQQYCFLLKTVQNQSLHLYCAPGVELPIELNNKSTVAKQGATEAIQIPTLCNPTIIDVSELNSDDILYCHQYKHDEKNKKFVFEERVSDIWKKLEQGEDIILTGVISDELNDHLATLLMPQPYLWHDGQKKTFKGKLVLQPDSLSLQSKTTPQKRLEPQTIHIESERKPALLNALKQDPIVFIEGKPGIGKSCFIRELMADPALNCFSFDPYDNASLKAWASSDGGRDTILFIDEATELGTDFTMFRALKYPKREILINGEIYKLTDKHYLVPIGNRKKLMPALLNENIPTLVFDTLTPDYVINNILAPIFAEIGQETSIPRAKTHYDPKKSVREMQGQTISICAKIKFASDTNPTDNVCASQMHPPMNKTPSRDAYHLTENRKPIFDAIIDSLHARLFMQQATADAAKYGGQTGHILEGLPGLGKSDIIHAAMLSANYEEVTVLNSLYDNNQDHRTRYYRIPATTKISKLRQHLKQAFDQGCIVHIDELDAMLKPDTPEIAGEVTRLFAELNAYLMGEDTLHQRPSKPGFMLIATGNGMTYHGRAPLPESLKSRLHQHAVQPYTQEDCEWIIAQKYPGLNASHLIKQFVQDPKEYTFRNLMTDCKKSDLLLEGCVYPGSGPSDAPGKTTLHSTPVGANNRPEGPIRPIKATPPMIVNLEQPSHTVRPIVYHFYQTRAFKISMPGILLGVGLGLTLTYTAAVRSIPIIAGLSVAGAITATIISACYNQVGEQRRTQTRLQSVSSIA